MAKKSVHASIVRTWAKENLDKIAEAGHVCLADGSRGRLHPEVIASFNRSNKNAKYDVETPAGNPNSLITVQLVVEKNGRKVPRKVTLTPAEVRTLTKTKPSRGRISTALKVQAATLKVNA